jgi:hypothetical protein
VVLLSDATALRALGDLRWIDLLGRYEAEVVLSGWVRREVRRFAE